MTMSYFIYTKGIQLLEVIGLHKLTVVDILLPLTNVCLNNEIYPERQPIYLP